MNFFKQAHTVKSDLWRWIVVMSIMFPLLLAKKDISNFFNNLLAPFYEFLSDFIVPVNVIQYYGINVFYIIIFSVLVLLLHCTKLSTLMKINKFKYIRMFISIFWTSFGYIFMISAEILCDHNSFRFNFNLLGFIELFFIGILMIAIKAYFFELFFRGYLLQFSNLLSRKRWQTLLISSSIYIVYMLFLIPKEELNFHILSFVIYFAFYYNVLVLLVDGLEVILGAHFVKYFLATIFLSENWYDISTNALFIAIPNRSINEGFNIFLNFYLPILLSFIYLIVVIKVFKIKNWKERISF